MRNICNICGSDKIKKINCVWKCLSCDAYLEEEITSEEEMLLQDASKELRLNKFDDAEESYKDIIRKYPKNSGGYWGLVLAKYGIKYEEDYDGKKIPTCYAISYESILEDENYKRAISLASGELKAYYKSQAELIERIRIEWVEKASREQPYDIFISFKDSDLENEVQQTKDSDEAFRLYVHLKDQGYNVFYSRESLKDKVGEKYEPYIFNALNTAKVMIVFGTKLEYVESTWIKNEWTRFYKRIKMGQKAENSLVVAYKNFSPNALPSILRNMQCMNIDTLTFLYDLDAHIAKVIQSVSHTPKIERVQVKARDRQKKSIDHSHEIIELDANVFQNRNAIARAAVQKRNFGNKQTMRMTLDLERELDLAYKYIDRGEFSDAEKIIDSVLVNNKNNAKALVGKLLIVSECKNLDEFSTKGISGFNSFYLLEKVLECTERDNALKILDSVCYEVKTAHKSNKQRAKGLFEQIYTYDYAKINDLRKWLFLKALAENAFDQYDKYFVDIYLAYEQDAILYVNAVSDLANHLIKKDLFQTAQEYVEKIKQYDHVFAYKILSLKLAYGVKTDLEVVQCIEEKQAYSVIKEAVNQLDNESISQWMELCYLEVYRLLEQKNFESAYKWLSIIAKYNYKNREKNIAKAMKACVEDASPKSVECFTLLIQYQYNLGEEYCLAKLKEFANKARSLGNFDLAEQYYDKALDYAPKSFELLWGKFYATAKCTRDGDLPKMIANLQSFDCLEDLLANCYSTGGKIEVLDVLVSACLEGYRHDACDVFNTFEKVIAYVPEGCDEQLVAFLLQMANECKKKRNFKQATKYYQMVLSVNHNHDGAHWGLLQAKLECVSNQELIKCKTPIGECQEFSNTLYAAGDNHALVSSYMDIQTKQREYCKDESKRIAKAKKNKKIITIVSIVLACCMLLLGWNFYYQSESKLKYLMSEPLGGYVVNIGKYYKGEKVVSIPAHVDGQPVVAIENNCFSNFEVVEEVVIPDTVVSIGDFAFSNCKNLRTVKGLGGLQSIGKQAFYGCTKLSAINLSDGVVSIGDEAFANTGLVTISLFPSVRELGHNVFEKCNALKSIKIENNTQLPTTWESDWRGNCTAPLDYSVKVGIDDGEKIFYVLITLNDHYVLDTPTKNGYEFLGWYNGEAPFIHTNTWVIEQNITLTAKWKKIFTIGLSYKAKKDNTYEVTGLRTATDTEIVIPSVHNGKWVTSIKASAFKGCNTIKSVSIPDSVTSIGYAVFSGCSSLESLTLPFVGKHAEVKEKYTSQYLFGYLFGEASYTGGVKTEQSYIAVSGTSYEYKDKYYYIPASLKSVTIAGGHIPGHAFENCSNLTSVVLGSGVTGVGFFAFSGCSNLRSVTLNQHAVNNFNSIFYSNNITSIVISDSVTSIGYEAFENCSRLTSVVIGNSVTSIDDRAFYGCSSLTSAVIGNSVTSIGNSAFSNCSGLISVVIPNSVTSIGNPAFYGCNKLQYTIENGIKYIGKWAFGVEDTTLNAYTLKDGTIGLYNTFRDCSSLTSVVIPNSVTSIGDSAFYGCSSLTSVVIPDSVTSIGEDAFYGCSSITSVVIPNSVKSIGSYAFENCSSLTSAVIGNSVTSIGNFAFYNCSSLASVGIPNSVTSIGSFAFEGCSSLTSVVIPDSVTSIGKSIFSGCSSLKSLTLPYVGSRAGVTASSTYQYPLGYLFGTDSYTGGVKTYQYYYGSSTSSSTSNYYYIPASLKSVTIAGGYIPYGAFYNCSSLTSVVIPNSVKSIGYRAFYNCSNLASVYYGGTEAQWNSISIDSYNTPLANATRYYYRETQPTTTGKYWHYDQNHAIVRW